MGTLITADLHLSDNGRDTYRHDWMRKLPALVKRVGAEYTFILGDLTEEKDRHSAWLVNQVCNHIYALAQQSQVFVLMGNHDYLDINNPFYEFLGQMDNVTWVGSPTHSHELDTDLFPCAFLPHTPNYKRDWRDLDLRGLNWIFAHNTFKGAKSEHGLVLDGIPVDVFPPDARVLAGDVHVPQTVGPVTYVGAPYLIDFGDDYVPRVWHIVKDRLDTIPCPGAQKRLVKISDPKELRDQKHVVSGDILKVRITLTPETQQHRSLYKEAVQKWASDQGYLLHQVQFRSEQPGRRMFSSRAEPETKSDEQVLTDFATRRGLDVRTLKTGRYLMRKG